ncbi:MAG: hypothetical protein JXR40_02700 [Pontiellaceae bacterium]|nr:hypothetical protein [Pontiellaceae bacterium]
MKSILTALTVLILSASISMAEEPTEQARYNQAQKLEREGDTAAAFLQYLSIPGAEHSAAALARSAPDTYLPLLENADAPTPVIQLIKGDLLLAKGNREGALACYRATAASIAKDYNTGWKDDLVPWNYFFVEPPEPKQALGKPFENSVGTQRDNWLIRRFIELDAMDDAEREFERIHQLHQHDTQPHVETWITLPTNETQQVTLQPHLTQSSGDDELSLRFALDYVDFLQQREKEAAALPILLRPLLVINLDKSPGSYQGNKQLTEEEAKQYPPKARGDDSPYHRIYIPSVGATREEFIQSVVKAYGKAGQLDKLLTALNEEIRHGNNAARLTLAQILDPERALELELAYIREAEFNPASKTYRRGPL